MTMLFGALLGVSGIRFWWHGLAALVALTVVLPFIGTAISMNSPLAQEYGYDFSPASIARVTAIQFLGLLFWYAVGAGVHWTFERLRRKPDEPE